MSYEVNFTIIISLILAGLLLLLKIKISDIRGKKNNYRLTLIKHNFSLQTASEPNMNKK